MKEARLFRFQLELILLPPSPKRQHHLEGFLRVYSALEQLLTPYFFHAANPSLIQVVLGEGFHGHIWHKSIEKRLSR